MGDHATINDPSATEATFADKGKGKAKDPEMSMEEDSDSESENGDEMVSTLRITHRLEIVAFAAIMTTLLTCCNRMTMVHNPSSPPTCILPPSLPILPCRHNPMVETRLGSVPSRHLNALHQLSPPPKSIHH